MARGWLRESWLSRTDPFGDNAGSGRGGRERFGGAGLGCGFGQQRKGCGMGLDTICSLEARRLG